MEGLARMECSHRNESSVGGISPRQLLRLKNISKSTTAKRPTETPCKSPICYRTKLQKAASESKLSYAKSEPMKTAPLEVSLISVGNFLLWPQQQPACLEEGVHRRPRSLSSTQDIMEEALKIGQDGSDMDNSDRSFSRRCRVVNTDEDDGDDVTLSDFSYSSWKSYWDLRPSGKDSSDEAN